MAKRKRKKITLRKAVQFGAVKPGGALKLLNGQRTLLQHPCCTILGNGCRNDRSMKISGGGTVLMVGFISSSEILWYCFLKYLNIIKNEYVIVEENADVMRKGVLLQGVNMT